jgi:hypothetical protein
MEWCFMAKNFSSVKLTSGFVDEARAEADLLHRSLGGQIEHWARLGKALENSPGFSMERVRETLSGRLRIENLSADEQDVVFDQLGAHFQTPSDDVREHYAALGRAVGAVGDDEHGNLVRRQSDGRLGPAT